MVGAYGSGFRACGGYGSRRGTAVRLSESSPHRLSIATRSGYRFRPFRPLSRSSARLGYVEGKNITIGWRVAQENFDRVREFADELVRLKVDVIASPGPTVTRMVKDVTSTIPLSWPMIPIRRQRVRRQSCDPVETSLGWQPSPRRWAANNWNCCKKSFHQPGDEFEFVINF